MSTMSARERMLGKLRAAPRSAAPVSRADIDARIAGHYAMPAAVDPVERVAQLVKAMSAVRTDIWCASPETWAVQLAAKLAEHGARRVLLDPARPEGAQLKGALPASVTPLAFDQPIEAWKNALFDSVDAGFTVARSGIAATGTLILEPDHGTPRTVSLAPPLHVALVYASTLHADMYSAVKAEGWQHGMPSNLVLASGPSKTSDIQQTLAYGAHGPRWMWVVIVMDMEPTGAEAQ
jgi:L-lactate dehydrogenase complex protein LldG